MGAHVSFRSSAPALALLIATSPASAQVLRGVVLDSLTGARVTTARVVVLTAAGTQVTDMAAGSDGSFAVHLSAPGRYRVRVSNVGYTTRTTEPIQVGVTFQASVLLRLLPKPFPLDSIVVEVPRRVSYLAGVGFYARRRAGWGYFLTRDDIASRSSAVRISDALVGLAGVRIICDNSRAFGGSCDVATPGSGSMYLGKQCLPSVVLDGVVLRAGGSSNSGLLDDLLPNPFNLEALEVYPSPAGVPVQYRGSACGAIIAWSRR